MKIKQTIGANVNRSVESVVIRQRIGTPKTAAEKQAIKNKNQPRYNRLRAQAQEAAVRDKERSK